MQVLPPPRLPIRQVRLPSRHSPSSASPSPIRLSAMDANAVEHLRSTFDRVLRSHSPAEGDPNLRPFTGLLLRNGSEILSVDSWQWRWRWKRRCPSPLRCIKAALFPVRCVFQWKGSPILIVWGEKLVPWFVLFG